MLNHIVSKKKKKYWLSKSQIHEMFLFPSKYTEYSHFSWESEKFRLERDLKRSLVQSPAQSCVSYEVQPGNSRLYPYFSLFYLSFNLSLILKTVISVSRAEKAVFMCLQTVHFQRNPGSVEISIG